MHARRRLLRYTLRGLLVLIGLVLAFLFLRFQAYRFRDPPQVRKAVIEDFGGLFGPPRVCAPLWARVVLGNAYRGNMTDVGFLDCKIDDRADLLFRQLAQLPCLRVLILNGSDVSDSSLRMVHKLRSLQHLYLRETSVTDAGVIHLQDLPQLSVLDLSQTRITDDALSVVSTIPKLRILALDRTDISDAGLLRLQDASDLTVVHITDNPNITPDAISALKDSVPGLQVVPPDILSFPAGEPPPEIWRPGLQFVPSDFSLPVGISCDPRVGRSQLKASDGAVVRTAPSAATLP